MQCKCTKFTREKCWKSTYVLILVNNSTRHIFGRIGRYASGVIRFESKIHHYTEQTGQEKKALRSLYAERLSIRSSKSI